MLRERDFQQRFANGMSGNPTHHNRSRSSARQNSQSYTNDDFGMPSPENSGTSSQRSSGLMGRFKMFNGGKSSHGHGYSGHDDDEDDFDGPTTMPLGPSDDPAVKESSMRDLTSMIGDRHRYPTFDGFNSASPEMRTMSMTSMSTRDSAPIIPVLTGAGGRPGSAATQSQAQYRQKMVESRRALMSSETGLPPPQALGSSGGGGSRLSSLNSSNQLPRPGYFGAPGERTMSLGAQSQRSGFGGPQFGLPGAFPPNQGPNPNVGAGSRRQTVGSMNHAAGPPMGHYPGSMSNLASHSPSPFGSETDLRQKQHAMEIERDNMLRHIQELTLRNSHLEHNAANGGGTSPTMRSLDPADDLNNRYDELLAQHNDLLEEHTRVHKELQQVKARAADLSKSSPSLPSVPEQTPGSSNLQQEELEELQQQLQAAQKERDSYKQSAEEGQALASELATALEEERKSHHQVQEQLTAMEAAHNAVVAKYEKLANESEGTEAISLSKFKSLQELVETLQADLDSVTVELAESSRREQGLETNSTDESLAGKLAAAVRELSIEREKRMAAEKINMPSADTYSLIELEHRHAEATQALNIRNQHYDLMQQRLTSLENEITSAQDEIEQLQLNYSHASVSSASQAELNDMARHLEVVKSENAKLQRKLDDLSDKSPLSERLKSTEKQRDSLQEALRALRERKDHELTLLQDNISQLQHKLDNALKTRTRVYSGIHNDSLDAGDLSGDQPNQFTTSNSFFTQTTPYSHENSSYVSFDDNHRNSQTQISDSPTSENLGDHLELPRIPKLARPASPLHLNFKIGSDFFMNSETNRSRADFRGPIPFALSDAQPQ